MCIRDSGLADCMQGEMISLPGNRYAIALNLERDSVGAVVMGPYADLAEGDVYKRQELKNSGAKQTGETLKINILDHDIPEDPAEEWLGSWINLLK